MRALVKQERIYGATSILDVPKPELKPGYVCIAIKASAVCGSDLHAYEYSKSAERKKIPIILGHEYSGLVDAVGEGVTRFAPGQRVMAESNQYCGHCLNCFQGRTEICDNGLMTGSHVDGGMAEYICVPENIVHNIPDTVSFEEAAVAQPCSVSFHGVFDNSCIVPGDVVMVFGAGIIGLMAAQGAAIMGARLVVVVGTDVDEATRFPLAASMGFVTLNATKNDLKAELKKLTGKPSVDVVVECSGAAPALAQAVELVRKGGSITVVGIYDKPVELFFTTLVRNEVRIYTSYTSSWKNYEQVLALIGSGQVKLNALITTYPFADALQAFRDLLDRKILKAVLLL